MAKRIDNREFVVTWMHSDSIEKIADTFTISKESAYAKANYLRKVGVKLPKFRRSGITELEVSQLNSIINKELKARGQQ